MKTEQILKCGDCMKRFFEPQIFREPRGDFWGMPAYEDVAVCPYCGSEFIFIDESENCNNE